MNLERIPKEGELLRDGERTRAPTVSTARDAIPAMMRVDFFVLFEEVRLFEESDVLLKVFDALFELTFFIGFIERKFKKKHTIPDRREKKYYSI